MSPTGPLALVQRTIATVGEPVIEPVIEPAFYPYNDTSLSEAERGFLKTLADRAAKQNLAEDAQDYISHVSIALAVFATFMVGLRFCARWRQGARILIDDYFILFALALLYGNLVFNLVFVAHKMGFHSGRLTLEELQYLDRHMIGAEIVYVASVTVYKIALLLLYFRVFPVPQVRRWGLWCGGVTLAWGLACTVAACVQCVPLHKVWEPWVDGSCINVFLTQLCISVPSTLCDVAILCLPIPHVLALHMNRGQRVLVLATFLLGGYVVFTSIYRFVVFLGYTSEDVPYTLSPGLAWNVVEVSSGIVGTCLPTLGPIVRLMWHRLLPSTIRSTGRSRGLSGGQHFKSSRDATGSQSKSQPPSASAQPWSKLPETKAAPRPEEAKYGIGLATMYQNGSDEGLELVVQHQVDIDVSIDAGSAAEPAQPGKASVGSSVTISGPVDKRPAKTAWTAPPNDSDGDGDEWPLAPRRVRTPPLAARVGLGRAPSTRR